MTVSEARAALPAVLDRVLAGEEVTLTRHGRAVAVIVRPDRLRTRRADEAFASANRLHDILEQGRQRQLTAVPPVTSERADALVEDVRAGRFRR